MSINIKTCKSGEDGCNFEMVTEGVNKDKYLELTPLINRQCREFGSVEVKKGKVHIYINLPKFLRNDNITPFTITDMIKLEIIRNDLEWSLKQTLKGTLGDSIDVLGATATSVECNLTQKVAGESTCGQVLNLINRSFYEGTNVVYQRASSKCRYLKEDETVIVRTKNYYVLKCYNKSLEQWKDGNKEIEDGLLRIEIIMLDRVLNKLFGDKATIRDVFQKESLMKVIDEYKRIFTEDVINKHIIPCLNDVTNILFESLTQTDKPVETIALCREIIIDEEVLWKALVKWHMFRGKSKERAERNADAYICRSKKYNFPRNVIDTIREFKYSCG